MVKIILLDFDFGLHGNPVIETEEAFLRLIFWWRARVEP